MNPSSDYAVVGAGIVGLSTALALADGGRRVTLYERARPGEAQSAGHTRIFRHHHDDPRLIAMAIASLQLWRKWERRFACELVGRDGVLMAGPTTARRALELHDAGVPTALLDADDQRRRLPYLRPFAAGALFDRSAGPIRVRSAIDGLAGALRAQMVNEEVLAVSSSRDGQVELITPGGSRRHSGAVICAGRDGARLAAMTGINTGVAATLHLRVTYPVKDTAVRTASCLQDSGGEHRELAYAAPLPDYSGYAVGLGGDDGPQGTHAGSRQSLAEWRQDVRERLDSYVASALPGLVATGAHETICWVTQLPWGADALAAWKVGGVVHVAGHNLFKLGPVLGRLLAQAVLTDVPEPLRPASRLGCSAPFSRTSTV